MRTNLAGVRSGATAGGAVPGYLLIATCYERFSFLGEAGFADPVVSAVRSESGGRAKMQAVP